MPTEYVLNKDTGLIFIVHDMMQIRSPLTPYLPTAAEILAGHKLVAAAPEPALDIEPKNAGALANLSMVLFHQGEIKDAREYCKKAQALGFDPPQKYVEDLRRGK